MEGRDIGLFIQSPKFYNNCFLFVGLSTLETFIKFWLVYLSVQAFQPLIGREGLKLRKSSFGIYINLSAVVFSLLVLAQAILYILNRMMALKSRERGDIGLFITLQSPKFYNNIFLFVGLIGWFIQLKAQTFQPLNCNLQKG